MITVLDCITHEHNLWRVSVAVLLCCIGSWSTTHLFLRATMTSGRQRTGWYVITAIVAGVAIWCTHFIAMLGYKPGTHVSFDHPLTVLSLFIAVIGSTAGFALAGSKHTMNTPAIGGAIVGLSIATMHYVGMLAYQVHGTVEWDIPYMVASVVLSVLLSSMALHFGMKKNSLSGRNLMAGLLVLGIATLHFTGMAAFHITAIFPAVTSGHTGSFSDLAVSISAMGFIIVIAGLASYLIDNSSRADTVERLRLMALNDMLTGLPNRINFSERLVHELEFAASKKIKLALIGIDLNRFKEINDTQGHKAGDDVLNILGQRLRGLLQEQKGEFIARTGGDEFAAFYRICPDDNGGLIHFLDRLEKATFMPVHLEHSEVTVGASFGVSIYPDDAVTKENLISNADLAMYRAKRDPLKRICFYEAGMDAKMKARHYMAADLRQALTRNQLSVHYQVQTSMRTGEIRGYEALLRWHHPSHGFIPPSEFIPVAEENGLIVKIGEWVLRSACATAARWHPPYKVAVNISAIQLSGSNLPDMVKQILSDTGLAPGRLELELTETAIFRNRAHALNLLREIKALGVSIALDDFGTGYSSLDTLRSFPFDKIKLDRSFLTGAETSDRGAIAIIRSVLALGKSLGIPVLAEGIETREQYTLLNNEGCDEAQGFLLGQPIPLEQIITAGQVTIDHYTDMTLTGISSVTKSSGTQSST
ncbi:TPA: putative bifunctional diguanylate cyclase/phosphodiesterase [Klebsiella oxytoca]